MIKVSYSGEDSDKIKKEVLKAYDFLIDIFLLKIPNIIVRIHNDRISFDKQLKTKTPDWCIANASDNNEIDILSPFAMEQQSSHRKSEFLPVLKHEFTHLFIDKLANGKVVPKWLNEGLAQYVAKQNIKQKNQIGIEINFCKKLSTANGWYQRIDNSAYPIAALFVNFLIKKYSFMKIKELLLSIDKKYSYPVFKNTFFGVYKIDLGEVEKLFMKEINR